MLIPFLAQAREVASSPSGCAMPWSPAGETHSGKAIWRSKTVVLVSVSATSTRTRGRRRYLEKALLFSLMVIWSVEPELKKSGQVEVCQCFYCMSLDAVATFNLT